MQPWFWLSLGVLVVGAVIAVAAHRNSRTKVSPPMVTPFRIMVGATAMAIYLLLFPTVGRGITDEAAPGKAIMATLYTTFQVFMANVDLGETVEAFQNATDLPAQVHSLYTVILFALAPLIAIGFILTFFQAFSAHVRYLLHPSREVNIFSELNELSVTLAQSIAQKAQDSGKDTVIVFTDVVLSNNEPSVELIGKARQLRAICFKNDILSLPLHRHNKKSLIRFFIMGSSDEENIWHATSILDDHRYKNRKNTDLYLFSDTIGSELALRYRGGEVRIRRINPARTLIYDWLWRDPGNRPSGMDLFHNAISKDGVQFISAAVVGLGGHGLEMVKALAWYCQMEDSEGPYHLHLNAYELDQNAPSAFARDYPGLVNDEYAKPLAPGDARRNATYEIEIHGGVDAASGDLIDELLKANDQHPLTFVFISLGDDQKNVEVAAEIRRAFARIHSCPQILFIARNSRVIQDSLDTVQKKLDEDAATALAKGKGLGPWPKIQVVGDIKDVFTYDAVVKSEIEIHGLISHLQWAFYSKNLHEYVQDFWANEYFYSSSICVPIHWRARRALDIRGARMERDEREKNGLVEFISRLEHARWCAFMSGDGFIYGENKDIEVARTHPLLVDFDVLSGGDRLKDDNDSRDVLPILEVKTEKLRRTAKDDKEMKSLDEVGNILADARTIILGNAASTQ